MKQFYLLFLCFAFIAGGGISTPVQASDKADSTGIRRYTGKLDSIQKIREVVIVGTPVIPKYREVIPAQVLKDVDLQRLNSFSVADAIRYFAGVQLKDYGGVGGLKTVNIRSMGTNHMAVFYDGIQLGNAQNGQVDLGRFSLDDVEEISLYNGQKSDIFQSAKDFGASGTIYITTRRPRFEEGKRANFKATMKTGSFGLINPSMRYEYKISDAVSSSFSGEWTNATGRYKFRYRRRNTLGEIAYDTTAYRQNGDINATRMEAGLHGKMADGQWTVRAYTYNSERGIPGAIVNNVFRHGERLWDTNSFIQGTLTNRWSKRFRTLFNAKYAADYTHYENQDAKLIQTKNTYKQKEFYFSCANLYNIFEHWEVSLAYDFQWNTLDATFYMPTEGDGTFPFPTRYTHMAALATAFEWGRLKMQASVLGYFVHEKVERFEARPDKAVATPAFFGSFKVLKNHDLSVRAFYKRMFRMPTFNDLYYTDMGNAFLKRAADIICSLVLIILTSPLMLIAAIGVKLSSPGPIIFRQERVGKDKKNFYMYKFRSMRVNSSENTGWSKNVDDRKTWFGSLIRKCSVDELPQFFNVLKGDMSLIGPRPELPFFVEQFKEEIPRYMVKHQVRPGITGWAQVNGLRGDTSIKKRIEYDLYYIENWTPAFDLRILIMTAFCMFNKEKVNKRGK